MDRPYDSQKLKPAQKSDPSKVNPPPSHNLYLILYNSVSAVLWTVVFARVVSTVGLHGNVRGGVYDGAGQWTKWTQTLAALEVLHSLLGIVRAPLLTTLMQVASRFLLVWGVVNTFSSASDDITTSPAYASMLLAWSTTEVIRYSYFAVNLARGSVPGAMTWLRYNTFFVLYPLGIGSECWLMYSAMGPARRRFGDVAWWGLAAILGVYVPGAYVLFTHMMAQRRKIMRGSRTKKAQ